MENLMNKNSILAIALSTIVVMVSLFINQKILQKNVDNAVYTEQTVQSNAEENTSTEKVITNNELVKPTSTKTTEEKITINTEKAEIILTNRGGDIISYKLLNHKDVDTNEGVQMVDNVSDMNRACAISFGGVDNSIINDIFSVEKISDYEYLFTKEFEIEKIGLFDEIPTNLTYPENHSVLFEKVIAIILSSLKTETLVISAPKMCFLSSMQKVIADFGFGFSSFVAGLPTLSVINESSPFPNPFFAAIYYKSFLLIISSAKLL